MGTERQRGLGWSQPNREDSTSAPSDKCEGNAGKEVGLDLDFEHGEYTLPLGQFTQSKTLFYTQCLKKYANLLNGKDLGQCLFQDSYGGGSQRSLAMTAEEVAHRHAQL